MKLMRHIMDWAGDKEAIVTIQQFGNFRDLVYDMDTAEGVKAVYDFMENRIVGGRACISVKCGCDVWYNAHGYVTSANVCEEHVDLLIE
jgi:hypothetical protein